MATASRPPSSRKRQRPKKYDDDDPSPVRSRKKARLDSGSPALSALSGSGALGVITSALSGAFDYGRRITSGKLTKDATQCSPRKRPCEIRDSEEERPTDNHEKSGIRTAAERKTAYMYDVPDSEDELSTPVRDHGGHGGQTGHSITKANATSPCAATSTQKRGNPIQSAAKQKLDMLGSKSRSPNRKSRYDVNAVAAAVPAPKLRSVMTPTKGKNAKRPTKSVAFSGEEGQDCAEVFFEDLPSRPAKSSQTTVARGNGPAQGRTSRTLVDEGVEAADEDEEICAVCRKPDSAPPNEIIFCDGCDICVHQDCYDIADVPEGDWYCRTCALDQGIAAGSPAETALAKGDDQTPQIANFEHHLRSLQRVLIDRCTGRRRINLVGQEEAYEKTFQLVEQTVAAGEGNSMLVIGARGSGKTTLVETVLSELKRDNQDDFHVVRLNGFIQTDDKLALKEIWRQLGKEMEVEDELTAKPNNYADTLASLLALLSHPSEIGDAQAGVTSRSVVFVIDEFDLFALHARQTLLYNLFDIAQAKKAPIAVLGLSTRIDVVESLEKRVKSRFSHRYVYLSLPKSLPAFWDICRHGLVVEEEEWQDEEGLDRTLAGSDQFLAWWSRRIEGLRKNPDFKDRLETCFYATKSVSDFLIGCVLPLSSLSPTSSNLGSHFEAARRVASIDAPDSKLQLLESLSELDLAMLIAAARLDIVAHTDMVNFAMAYDEYASLIGKQRAQSASSGLLALGAGARVWSRGVASVAWERLVSLGLLLPARSAGRGAAASLGGVDDGMWKADVVLEDISSSVKLNAILARWCREI